MPSGAVTSAHGDSVQYPFRAMESLEKRKEPYVKGEPAALQEAKCSPAQRLVKDNVSVSIRVWECPFNGMVRTFYSCTFERCYRDHNGNWHYTTAFDLGSLGQLHELAEQAAGWIGAATDREGPR